MASESSPKRRRRGRDGLSKLSVFTMANKWKDNELKIVSDVMQGMPLDDARSSLLDRYIMLEKKEANNPDSFAQRTHYFGVITNFVTSEPEVAVDDDEPEVFQLPKHLITIKVFNQRGEIDGKPSDEEASQLWLMPEIGTTYIEDDGVQYALVEYDTSIVSCAFKVKAASAAEASSCNSPAPTPSKKPLTPKQQSRGKSNEKVQTKRKTRKPNKNAKRRLKLNKSKHVASAKAAAAKLAAANPADAKAVDGGGGGGASTSGSGPFKQDSVFTLEALLRSFENPKGKTIYTGVFQHPPCLSLFVFFFLSEYPLLADDLFSRSLEAEIKARPRLLDLTEKDAEKYAPDLTFGRRRKGFHKAPALERVLVLQCFRWMPVRGEFFVTTKLKGSEVHHGLRVFAHGFYLFYVSLLYPQVQLLFHPEGNTKSTDRILWKLSMFVSLLARAPYNIVHIWSTIYGRPYMAVHI